jgi:hypothetical protein
MVEHEGMAAGVAERKHNGVAEPKAIAVDRVRDEGRATGVDGTDQGKPATVFKVVVVGIGVVLLGFGVAVYGFKAHQDLAIVAIGGTAGFAIIDLWLPRRDQRAMRRLRPYMPLWSLVPFVVALMMSAWVDYRQWQRGLKDIHELAEELYGDPALKLGQITSTTVENAVHNIIARHFPVWSAGAKSSPPDRPAATYQPVRVAAPPSTSEAAPPGSAATTEPRTEAASPGPTEPPNTSETYTAPSDSAAGADEEERNEKRRFIDLAHVVGYDLARLEHEDRRKANARQAKDSKRRDDEHQANQRQQRQQEVQAHSQAPVEPAPQDECEEGSLPRRLTCMARLDTRFHACLVFFVQALFVLWIPFLLVVSIARASARLALIQPMNDAQDTPGPAAAGPSPARALSAGSGLRCDLDDVRDLRILAEDHAYFMPRLCFAALLLLGTTYVFAPFGLKTSYMMSLVEAHALPGHTSFVLWCNHFAAAPVITVGFVGFLIYALITATQRFVQDDFDDIAMFSLLIRGMIVILLSLALSAAPIGDVPARLFVFVAGLFPMRALEALAKRANISLDPELTVESSRSFVGIPNLDPTKVFVLRAAGVQSTYDLASMPIKEIVGRVRIDPRLLGRAVDHAILLDAVGPEIAGQLAPHAITSAMELIEASRTALPGVLSDAARRAADRLAKDPRITELQKWLGYTPSQPAAAPAASAAVAADPVAVAAGEVVRSVAHDDPGDDG